MDYSLENVEPGRTKVAAFASAYPAMRSETKTGQQHWQAAAVSLPGGVQTGGALL